MNSKASFNPYADERYISSEVSFELIDVDASNSATATGSKGTFFSNLKQTHDKITAMSNRIATLEPEGWILDGGYTFVSESSGNNGEVGYWSDKLSDSNCNIDVSLEFQFSSNQDSKAFTIIFDETTNNYATDFELTTYNASGSVIKSTKITNNKSNVIIVDLPSTNYTKLVARFTKTNLPHRHLRITEIVFGYLKIFKDDEIVGMSFDFDSSIDSQNLPSNKFTLTIDNTDRRYNIIAPDGIYKYLQKGQGLNASVYINGERILMGRFYFSSSKSNDNSMTAEITAYDWLYFMDNIECNIGSNGTWTVSQAVSSVIKSAGLNLTYTIPSTIASRTIYKSIPQGTSVREALRLIAQAGRSVCYINRLDVLEFVEPTVNLSGEYLDNNRMINYPSITDNGLINKVELTVKNEYVENSTEVVYTATDKKDDEEEKILAINNPLVYTSEVAKWILKMAKYRIQYDITERGNPKIELQEKIKVYDVYNSNKDCVIIGQKFDVGVGLFGTIKAVTDYS